MRPLSYCISDDLGTIKRLNYSRGDLQPKCTCVCCAVLKHVPAKGNLFLLPLFYDLLYVVSNKENVTQPCYWFHLVINHRYLIFPIRSFQELTEDIMGVLNLLAAIFTLLCFSRASSIYQTQRDTIGIKGYRGFFIDFICFERSIFQKGIWSSIFPVLVRTCKVNWYTYLWLQGLLKKRESRVRDICRVDR